MARYPVESEVTGTVWKVEVGVGDSVTEGDVLLILESMKMEIPVESPQTGTVIELLVFGLFPSQLGYIYALP
ncbi:MAG: acetyl-CoA carboxylase biotin carboxyl carrier protein subunit [Pseudomonadales bacterium]|nr:acetyl-CoA carboxylase biotin carboxyl carrier protein subunit [Pseudomonadales bacterium]